MNPVATRKPALAALTVPYSALAAQAAEVKAALLDAFETVLDSGRYVLGPNLSAFEAEFAAYCGAAIGIGVGNGTDALTLALRALNIGPGDEVITAPNSFIATAASIAHVGARPVFADIGADLNIDPDMVEAAITPATRAIVPVHLTGRPARMPRLLDIAAHRGLIVIEDAAQAVGAALNGKRVGSWASAACFSLHPLKNLHAFGDGGMVTAADPETADLLRMFRNHGLRNRDCVEFWGFNSRLDELQAALLRVQLPLLNRWTDERRRLAFRYNDLLRPWAEVPEEGPGEFCTYQTYAIQARQRDALQKFLKDNGVEALVHYPTPIHRQPAAAALGYGPEHFPMAERAAASVLSLPLYPGLTEAQQNRVVDLVSDFYRRSGLGGRTE
jgi:dTDP-4-amino-4,6-dideoxygalactose transaminase